MLGNTLKKGLVILAMAGAYGCGAADPKGNVYVADRTEDTCHVRTYFTDQELSDLARAADARPDEVRSAEMDIIDSGCDGTADETVFRTAYTDGNVGEITTLRDQYTPQAVERLDTLVADAHGQSRDPLYAMR